MARGRFSPVGDEDKKRISFEGLKKAFKIFRFIKPYRSTFVVGLLFLALSSLTSLSFPYVTGHLVDAATGKIMGGWSRNQIALGLLSILIAQSVFSFLRVWLFTSVSENTLRDIRLTVYSRLITLPVSFFEKRRVGELTSRLTGDIAQLSDILSFTLAELFRQVITLIIGIGIIFYTSPKLTLVMISTFPLLVIGAILFGNFIRKLSKKATDEHGKANTVVEETLQGIFNVKAFANEAWEIIRYKHALGNVLENSLKAARFRGLFISFVILAIFGGIVLVLWYGLGLVEEGKLSIGGLVSFIIYTTFIGGAVGGLGDLYGQLQKTIGASERVMEILAESPEPGMENPQEKTYPRIGGDIIWKDAGFAYPSRPEREILKGLSLSIPYGAKVALVGHSGSGKSTMAALMLRFHELQKGTITLGGHPIHSFELPRLRHHIGLVPQDTLLFGGSIRENIAYGRPGASDNEIIEAAKKAYAWEFIAQFSEGLDTIVGERGVKLSGGQRQRISIARAILKDPEYLILDEATSSLDSESERMVQLALENLMEGRTTIIIAHRLATIRSVDTIFVLDAGKVIESGSHQKLLENEGLYYRLNKMQEEGNFASEIEPA